MKDIHNLVQIEDSWEVSNVDLEAKKVIAQNIWTEPHQGNGNPSFDSKAWNSGLQKSNSDLVHKFN